MHLLREKNRCPFCVGDSSGRHRGDGIVDVALDEAASQGLSREVVSRRRSLARATPSSGPFRELPRVEMGKTTLRRVASTSIDHVYRRHRAASRRQVAGGSLRSILRNEPRRAERLKRARTEERICVQGNNEKDTSASSHSEVFSSLIACPRYWYPRASAAICGVVSDWMPPIGQSRPSFEVTFPVCTSRWLLLPLLRLRYQTVVVLQASSCCAFSLFFSLSLTSASSASEHRSAHTLLLCCTKRET